MASKKKIRTTCKQSWLKSPFVGSKNTSTIALHKQVLKKYRYGPANVIRRSQVEIAIMRITIFHLNDLKFQRSIAQAFRLYAFIIAFSLNQENSTSQKNKKTSPHPLPFPVSPSPQAHHPPFPAAHCAASSILQN
jgi:hypothetical protein